MLQRETSRSAHASRRNNNAPAPRRSPNWLQAEQLAELAQAAELALQQQRANERLREEMQREFATQQVALQRQAEARRAELERLRESGASSLQEQFTTLSQINAAIRDIDSRFEETIARTLGEIDSLGERRAAALEEENPMDPWETPEEWAARLAEMRAQITAETDGERTARRRELESSRAAELQPLVSQRDALRADLNGREYTLGSGATRVVVRDFNPYEKRFPIVLTSTAEETPFSASLSYEITSRDRDVLREEYYRVFSADQANGLSGEFTYRVYELYPDVWAVVPHEARVINLLEDDAVLTTAPGGQEFLIHTDAESGRVERWAGAVEVTANGAGRIELEAGPARLVHTRDGNALIAVPRRGDLGRVSLRIAGRTRTLRVGAGFNPPANAGALLVVAGMARGTRLEAADRNRDYPDGGTARITLPRMPASVTIHNRYIEEPVRIALNRGATGTTWIDGAAATQPVFGRVALDHSGPFIVLDANRHVVANADDGYELPLAPGEYTIGYAGEDDPYVAATEGVTVSLGATSTVTLTAPQISTRFELGRAQAEHAGTEAMLSRGRARRIAGWSLIGAGVLSLGGAAYSYSQGTAVRADYDDTTYTADARAYRADAAQWGLTFSVTAIAGAVLDAGGAALLAVGPNRSRLIRERNELQRQIDALSARFAAETVQQPILGMELATEVNR